MTLYRDAILKASVRGTHADGFVERVNEAERVKAGDTSLYELIMRRYNQRLYRVARAILRDDAEAEDVMQDAYVRAYQHLHQFAARAPFSAWLTSIAIHEALGRLRLRKQNPQLDDTEHEGEPSMNVVETSPNPEQSASRAADRLTPFLYVTAAAGTIAKMSARLELSHALVMTPGISF
jgi:DNA-directed RNA polymerase specialized sigma24 family protein